MQTIPVNIINVYLAHRDDEELEITESYNDLCDEIFQNTPVIHTYQTWPLDFEKELRNKYGYSVRQVDMPAYNLF